MIQFLLSPELWQGIVQDLELDRGEDQLQHLPDSHHNEQLQKKDSVKFFKLHEGPMMSIAFTFTAQLHASVVYEVNVTIKMENTPNQT